MPNIVHGQLEFFLGIYVTGWLLQNSDDRDVTLKLCIDDVVISEKKICFEKNDPNAEGSRKEFKIPVPGHFFDNSQHKIDILAAYDGEQANVLEGGPLFLGELKSDGFLDTVDQGTIKGWCCPRSFKKKNKVDVYIDDTFYCSTIPSIWREDLFKIGIHTADSGFSIPLPDFCFDSRQHKIDVFCMGRPLKGSPKIYKASYRGFVDSITEKKIIGWIVNYFSESKPVVIDIDINDKIFVVSASVMREDLEGDLSSKRHGFELAIPKIDANKDAICIKIKIHGTDCYLHDMPLVLCSTNGENSINTHLSNVSLKSYHSLFNCSKGILVPYFSKEIYRNISFCKKSYSEILLKSYLTSNIIFIVIIDDASKCDVDAITYKLECISKLHIYIYIIYTENSNIGQPIIEKFKLKGLDCLSEYDFSKILLNKILPSQINSKFDNICIMTVDQNNIHTFKDINNLQQKLDEFPLLDSISAITVFDVCDQVIMDNEEQFCKSNDTVEHESWSESICYLNRPRENASMACIRNVDMFCNVKSNKKINDIFEDYYKIKAQKNNLSHGLISSTVLKCRAKKLSLDSFVSSLDYDKFNSIMNNEFIKYLSSNNIKTILHVNHSLGGGIERHVNDLSEFLDKSGFRSLTLLPVSYNIVKLIDSISKRECKIVLDGTNKNLIDLLKKMNIVAVHFHHVILHRQDVWDIPKELNIPYFVTIHDYYWICPRVTMIDKTDRYCGEKNSKNCSRCLSISGCYPNVVDIFNEYGGNVVSWRKRNNKYLSEAKAVIVPSKDVKSRIEKYFIDLNIQLLPHPERNSLFCGEYKKIPSSKIKIAIIGGIGPHKGLADIAGLVKYSYINGLNFKFYLIGTVGDESLFDGLDNVIFTGKYHYANIQNILKKLDCHIALFLSQWPETYCYTLSEALAAGLVPVSYDIGAPMERVLSTGIGKLIPFPSTPNIIAQRITEAYRWRVENSSHFAINIGSDIDSYMHAYIKCLGLRETLVSTDLESH